MALWRVVSYLLVMHEFASLPSILYGRMYIQELRKDWLRRMFPIWSATETFYEMKNMLCMSLLSISFTYNRSGWFLDKTLIFVRCKDKNLCVFHFVMFICILRPALSYPLHTAYTCRQLQQDTALPAHIMLCSTALYLKSVCWTLLHQLATNIPNCHQ